MRTQPRTAGVVATCAVAGLVLLAGCGDESVTTGPRGPSTTTNPTTLTTPSRDADLLGVITALTRLDSDNDVAGTILVEASGNEPVGTLGDKASLKVTDSTRITVCGPGDLPEPGSFESLSTGNDVYVWVDGPVAESYPVQATASRISTSCG